MPLSWGSDETPVWPRVRGAIANVGCETTPPLHSSLTTPTPSSPSTLWHYPGCNGIIIRPLKSCQKHSPNNEATKPSSQLSNKWRGLGRRSSWGPLTTRFMARTSSPLSVAAMVAYSWDKDISASCIHKYPNGVVEYGKQGEEWEEEGLATPTRDNQS